MTELLEKYVSREGKNEEFDVAQAVNGFFRDGKGRGKNPAALNFADCIAYGTAKALDVSLLFQGNDFSKTEVAHAR